eukprot:2373049-Pleurochrysis_carterae.AAC.10
MSLSMPADRSKTRGAGPTILATNDPTFGLWENRPNNAAASEPKYSRLYEWGAHAHAEGRISFNCMRELLMLFLVGVGDSSSAEMQR